MINIEEYLSVGRPIPTEIGECKFIKVYDYPIMSSHLYLIQLSKYEIINLLKKQKKSKDMDEFIKEISNADLFTIVANIADISKAYIEVLSYSIENFDITKVNKDNFNEIRDLIMKINCLQEEEYNTNPEIQKTIERSRRVKNQNLDNVKFSDIISSVCVGCGYTYKEVGEFSLYQLYLAYQRLGYFKNYDTSTLFATVSSDKINIESWSKHIDLFKKESHGITYDQFKKNIGSAIE